MSPHISKTASRTIAFGAVIAATLLLTTFAQAEPAPAAQPDLVVDDIEWSPANPVAGDSVVFTAQIRNQGTSCASNFTVAFKLDGDAIGNASVDLVCANQTRSVTSPPWTATAGNHTIEAVADSFDQVAESNESNNARSESFSVPPAMQLKGGPGPLLPASLPSGFRALLGGDAASLATRLL